MPGFPSRVSISVYHSEVPMLSEVLGIEANKWLEMVNAVQAPVTPHGKHTPNEINLESQTFISILQSAIVWRILILSINNAIRCGIPLHSRQWLWEGEDNIPRTQPLKLFQKEQCLQSGLQRTTLLSLGETDLLLCGWMDHVGWMPPVPWLEFWISVFPFVWMARLPTVGDNERCSETLLFHTRRVTYNFSWVTFDLGTDSLIYCPMLWFMSIFSE